MLIFIFTTITEEDKKAVKEEKKGPGKTSKEPISQKAGEDGTTSQRPVNSAGSGSGRRGTTYKPALPTMSATPDIPPDGFDDDDDQKLMKIPEGILDCSSCVDWEINAQARHSGQLSSAHLSAYTVWEVRKRAKIRNRINPAQHLTQDTNGKVTMSQLDITNESQEVSPFPAGDHKASTNTRALKHNKTRQK